MLIRDFANALLIDMAAKKKKKLNLNVRKFLRLRYSPWKIEMWTPLGPIESVLISGMFLYCVGAK